MKEEGVRRRKWRVESCEVEGVRPAKNLELLAGTTPHLPRHARLV
jgi:hypothetical protein